MANVNEVIPFLAVADIDKSAAFYMGILDFEMPLTWRPGGKLQWCQLRREGAAIMLQQHSSEAPAKADCGISIYFICNDALEIYRTAKARGVEADQPFVGNNMWVVSFKDPDGYAVVFESSTGVPEDTKYDPVTHR